MKYSNLQLKEAFVLGIHIISIHSYMFFIIKLVLEMESLLESISVIQESQICVLRMKFPYIHMNSNGVLHPISFKRILMI